MTRNEAIQSMRDGNKVKHHYFSPEEYLFMSDGKVQSEDGVNWGYPERNLMRGTCLDPSYAMFNEGWEVFMP